MVGGSSYGADDKPETFTSVAAAREYVLAFWANFDGSTPCAENVEFHWYGCPAENVNRQDPYPDEVWTRGPRGGVARCPA